MSLSIRSSNRNTTPPSFTKTKSGESLSDSKSMAVGKKRSSRRGLRRNKGLKERLRVTCSNLKRDILEVDQRAQMYSCGFTETPRREGRRSTRFNEELTRDGGGSGAR